MRQDFDMEATAFPVRTARGALMLGGRHTEVVVSRCVLSAR